MALPFRQRGEPLDHRAERLSPAVAVYVGLGGADYLQGPGLALLAGAPPGSDPVPTQDHPNGLRVVTLDGCCVQAKLETGPPPRHPPDAVAEAGLGQGLTVH